MRGPGSLFNLIVGLTLIALGSLFLLARIVDVNVGRLAWPLLILVPGLILFAGMLAGGRRGGRLAIPASFLTILGLILLYQSATDHWESWAYAWLLLIPTSIGLGLLIQGLWRSEPGNRRTGGRLTLAGLGLFAIGAFFFEIILNISGRAPDVNFGILIPVVLIVAGALIIAAGLLPRARRPGAAPPEQR